MQVCLVSCAFSAQIDAITICIIQAFSIHAPGPWWQSETHIVMHTVTELCVCPAQLGLTMQAMYPERMYRCFIINAPSFFTMLWRVMDPLMTERVKKKISIFRTVRLTLTVIVTVTL